MRRRTSMPPGRRRILIADDHTLFGELCRNLLEAEFDVVGTVRNGHALVRAAAKLQPDLIVLEIALPQLNGLDAGAMAKQVLPGVKLVYLTMISDPKIAVEAFRRGASACLLKTCNSSELITTLREVLEVNFNISKQLSGANGSMQRRETAANGNGQLTERQLEVLSLLAEGKQMKEVADILKMTTRTVAFHKYRIMGVLGAKSNAELIRYALRHNLISA